jgi:TP901 family phage tail tape measure protein
MAGSVSIGTVEGVLRLRDEFTGALTKAQGQLKTAGKNLTALGQSMTAAGSAMTFAVTAPIALIGGAAVKSFASFDSAMTQSLAIMGDVSEALQTEMADSAREMAKTTTFSAKQAAESYFFLASAGLDAESSIAALPAVAAFAQAGMFDMALATDLLTDAQSALGLTIRDDAVANMENMVRVSDVLVKANTLANASVEQFSKSLTTEAGAALKTFGIDVEEGVAVLAAFADQGVKSEVAGTSLSRILRLMSAAAVKNADDYKRLGVTVFDTSGNIRNMADIVEDLEGALLHLSDEERVAALNMLGFQARVQGVINPLLGTSAAIRRYEAELRKAGGTTQEVADKQLQTFAAQMSLVKDRLIDAAITLGSSLAPVIQNFAQSVLVPLIDKLSAAAEMFGKLPQPIQAIIIGALALVAALGPVLLVAGLMVSALGALATMMAGPMGAAIAGFLASVMGPAGLAAAGIAVLVAWEPTREVLRKLAESVLPNLEAALRPIGPMLKELRDLAKELGSGVTELADALVGLLDPLLQLVGLTSSWSGVLEVASVFQKSLTEGLAALTIAVKFQIDILTRFVQSLSDAVNGLLRLAGLAGKVEVAPKFDASEVSEGLEGLDEELRGFIEKTVHFKESLVSAEDALSGLGKVPTPTSPGELAEAMKLASEKAAEMATSLAELRAEMEFELEQTTALQMAHLQGAQAVTDLTIQQQALERVMATGVSKAVAYGSGLVTLAEAAIRAKQTLDEMGGAQVVVLDLVTGSTTAITDNSAALEQNQQRYALLAKTGADASRTFEETAAIIGELSKALAAGVISQDDFNAALERLGQESTNIFGSMATEFGTAIANMVVESDSLGESLEAIFVGRAKQAITEWVSSFISGFGRAVQAAQQDGADIAAIVKTWGRSLIDGAKGFKDAFVAAAAVAKGSVIGALKAIIAFMNSTWIGLVLTIIAIVVSAFVALAALFKKGADDTHNAVKELGVHLSAELMKQIRLTEKAIGDASASIRQHLDDVIREAVKNIEDLAKMTEQLALILTRDLAEGIIDSSMAVDSMSDAIGALIEKFEEAGGGIEEFQAIIAVLTDDVIAAFEAGLLTAAEAADIIGANFDELLELALSLGDEGVAAIEALVDAVNAAGLSVEEIAAKLRSTIDEALKVLADRSAFLVEQAETLVSSIEALFAAGSVGPRQLQFAATAAIQAFDAMMEAGVPLSEILFQLQDALTLIGDRAGELGADLPAAFAEFGEMLAILAGEQVQAMIGQLEALGGAASAAGNLGLLTAEQFDTFGDSTRRAFRNLVADGLTGEQALAALAPQLQQLHDLSQQYGFTVDKNTQALIDQAMAQGLVQDKGLTTEDILIKGFDRMLEALNALIETLGGVPIAFESIGAAAEDAAATVADSAEDAATSATESFESAAQAGEDAMLTVSGAVMRTVGDVATGATTMSDALIGATGEASEEMINHLVNFGLTGLTIMDSLAAGAASTARVMADSFEGIPITFQVEPIHMPGGGEPLSAQHGTGGFMNFGQGTSAVLHGTEQVITAAEGTGIAQMVAQAIAASGRGGDGDGLLVELVREQLGVMVASFTQGGEHLKATDKVWKGIRDGRRTSKPFQSDTPGTVC